ncbi:hypothetical protein EON65_51045, partial [archaeon]
MSLTDESCLALDLPGLTFDHFQLTFQRHLEILRALHSQHRDLIKSVTYTLQLPEGEDGDGKEEGDGVVK